MKRILLLTVALLLASPAWADPVPGCMTIKQAVPYAECIVAWENANLRARYPFPDLLDRLHAARLELAARYDRGEITKTEANAALKRVEAEVYLEGKRRIDRQFGRINSLLDSATSRRTECIGVDFGGGISTLSC